MCRKFSVFGCKSNYDTQQESVTVYTFPQDEDKLARWLAALSNGVNITDNSVVCRKHWPEEGKTTFSPNLASIPLSWFPIIELSANKAQPFAQR